MKNNEIIVNTSDKINKKNHQKKKDKKHRHHLSEKKNHQFRISSHRDDNNFLLNMNYLEKSLTSKDINSIDENYKKDLYVKFFKFLNKKKFKISNKFDAKNSKKFLDKKNKCLEKMILSDIIENTTNDFDSKKSVVENSNHDFDSKRSLINVNRKFRTEKSVSKYFIVITNYDEEIKSKNSHKY
jgi:hypothetical protein